MAVDEKEWSKFASKECDVKEMSVECSRNNNKKLQKSKAKTKKKKNPQQCNKSDEKSVKPLMNTSAYNLSTQQ